MTDQEIFSGVRKYAPYTMRHAVRRWWLTRNVGSLGKGVFVEADVGLMRHPEKMFFGDYAMLKEGVRLCTTNPSASISIGSWTTIGYHCFLFAATRIDIGANCLIAPFCYLVDSMHGTAVGKLIREQPMTSAPITIGNDVWLGVGVTVMAGVTIGAGSVVGARSVVTTDIPENSIAIGAPARVTRMRE